VQRIHQSAKLALGAAQLVFQRQQVRLLLSLRPRPPAWRPRP
jgi:hypothetical protein